MKSLKDIENMSLEQLETVSKDESIAVPEGLTQRVQEMLEVQAKVDKVTNYIPSTGRRIRLAVGAVASFVILAGLGLEIARWQNEPEDTFDDPYLAYAELEKAFALISDGMQKGLSMARESEEVIDRTATVFSEQSENQQ